MQLPKEFTTVTTLSKTVALLMFITLPIIAFIFGTNYQKIIDSNQIKIITPTETIIINPTTTQPNKYRYECPKTGYVDCMPGTRPVKKECSSDFLRWAQENCPNFKGGAY